MKFSYNVLPLFDKRKHNKRQKFRHISLLNAALTFFATEHVTIHDSEDKLHLVIEINYVTYRI